MTSTLSLAVSVRAAVAGAVVGGRRETIGPGGAAGAGGVARAGFVSAGRTFVAALRASLPLGRADSLFDSTGTSGTRGFFSATRGRSSGTAACGVTVVAGGAAVAAGGVAGGAVVGVGGAVFGVGGAAVGAGSCVTDVTGGVAGEGRSCVGIHIHSTVANMRTPLAMAAITTYRRRGAVGTGAGISSRRTSSGGPLRCSAAFFSASRMYDIARASTSTATGAGPERSQQAATASLRRARRQRGVH